MKLVKKLRIQILEITVGLKIISANVDMYDGMYFHLQHGVNLDVLF